MALKAKTRLSSLFRRLLRNTRNSSCADKTSEVNAGDSREIEATGISLYGDLRHLCAPSDTGPDSVTMAVADKVSSSFKVNSGDDKFILPKINDEKGSSKNALAMLDPRLLPGKLPLPSRHQQVLRDRINSVIFNKRQSEIIKNSEQGCARKVGNEIMLIVLKKMGKDAGEKEYNAMVKLCIQHARRSSDVEYALDQIGKAMEYLKEIRQLGFSIKEEVYGPFFKYLVDMEMVHEFQILKDFIREATPESLGKLVYYELLLWIQLNDEEKIHELCNTVDDSGISLSTLQEYYLAALCEKDSKENLQKLLEIVDITEVSSPDVLKSIFGYLGNSLLDSVAVKLLWELRDCGKDGVTTVSNLIYSYTTCIPNLTTPFIETEIGATHISQVAVEDAILKFNKLHEELDILPSSSSYEELVSYLCGSNEVATALDVVENMCAKGLVISENILHSLLDAIEQILEFNLVQRIKLIMRNKSVKPNSETFRRSINLCIRIKDFEGAHNMLCNLKNFNLAPNSSMYNSILAGYCREKKMNRALMVLKEMKEADVKPDSITFSYLINFCNQEEAIAEYYEEMKQAGVQANKRVYMSLIKAYASCGQFEKSKQVLMDLEVPAKDYNELKSVLISALASNGKITDAFSIYEEMKKADCPVEPKAIISLIENSDSNEELRTLVQLAHELCGKKCWIDGFFRIIVFAVRNNKSSSILDLLKQTKNHFSEVEISMEYWFEEVFRSIAETEPSDVKLGVDLVSFMKEELGLCPSRKCLDFLLHACVNAKDKPNALMVWKEYQFAELPYNVLNYLRMYQVLIASGDSKSAKAIISEIPSDDRDVKSIIKESHIVLTPKKTKKKKKKTFKKETIIS